ncbi:MAG: hypothetical protein Q4E33_02905 [Erysipelotrichaceae bacterium]|nr:hypothetical protein [Erysipelotrichaceae bacterium]
MGRGRFLRDDSYPTKLWGVYDHQVNELLERYKSKTTKDRSYPKIYKSFAAAQNYIVHYLNNDFERYEIREYVLANPK